jgi:flagellar basal body-associated protein FliL
MQWEEKMDKNRNQSHKSGQGKTNLFIIFILLILIVNFVCHGCMFSCFLFSPVNETRVTTELQNKMRFAAAAVRRLKLTTLNPSNQFCRRRFNTNIEEVIDHEYYLLLCFTNFF